MMIFNQKCPYLVRIRQYLKMDGYGNKVRSFVFFARRERGFLTIENLGGRVRNWKRRWFVITDGCLFYFETRTVRMKYSHFLLMKILFLGNR